MDDFNGFMAFFPIILYATIAIVVSVIYTYRRIVKDEEFFKPEHFPQIKQRVSYTAPIVGLVVGGIFSILIIGLPVVAISLVVLTSRINFNKRVDLWNTQLLMGNGANR